MTAHTDAAARILRGRTLSFRDDPRAVGPDRATHSHEDGAVVVGEGGRILWHGAHADLPHAHAGAPCAHHRDALILPGLIDAHVHFPQHRMLAAPAHDLLEWLDRFAFPEEARYAAEDHARAAAERFLDKLASHGTTSALVFSTVHGQAADCLFRAARRRGLCLMTGATMMDRNAPAAVTRSAEESARESARLIASWHGVERLRYALTVRFAVTSSEAQLRLAGEILADHPGCLLHTHLSESTAEIELVQRLFPWSKDYTHVYERFGLVGQKSVFAHGIHLSERECQALHDAGSMVVHCPTSNAFLGSGLFDIEHVGRAPRPVRVGVATDIGGGTSYSLLQTLAEAYKIARLKGCAFSAFDGFYLATLGNARGLGLDSEIGTLDAGRWADVVVLDPQATPVLAGRHELSESLEDTLFALMMLGDDRAVRAVYVKGRKVAGREGSGGDG